MSRIMKIVRVFFLRTGVSEAVHFNWKLMHSKKTHPLKKIMALVKKNSYIERTQTMKKFILKKLACWK